MTDAIFRGEHYEVSIGLEDPYGTDPGAASLITPLGVFERAQIADPEIEFTPFYGGGGAQARRYFRAYRGRWALEGSIGDVLLLNAMPLVLPIGSVVTSAPASGVYTHTLTEETVLKSFTQHVSCWRADDADATPTLMRRYSGGKVGRATLSAEENERLRISFDNILFKDLRHNIAAETTKYDSNITKPTLVYPTTEPFFFSGGTLTIANTVFARVRSFRLDINNNCEAKYYIAGHDVAIPLPYTVLEGKREYGLAITVDPTDTALYQEVLTQGIAGGQPVGIQVKLTMARHATDDEIELTIPPGAVSVANQGCFIKRGRLDIDSGAPAIPQELEILARAVGVVVKDADAWTEWN